jgi:hypothetical protein
VERLNEWAISCWLLAIGYWILAIGYCFSS